MILFLISFLLVLTRISSVVLTAPILGSRHVPLKFRIVLAALISLVAFPVVYETGTVPTHSAAIVNAIFSEAVIGITLGLGVTLLFSAAQSAGAVIGQLAGIQWPTQSSLDSGEASSPVSQIFAFISLAAFALMGGPELLLGATLSTFRELPPGSSLNLSDIPVLLSQLLQQSFVLTLRGVGPAIAALMISTWTIGLIGRSYPQINTLGLGLTSNQFILFFAIFLTLGSCVWLFVDDLESVVALIRESIQVAGTP